MGMFSPGRIAETREINEVDETRHLHHVPARKPTVEEELATAFAKLTPRELMLVAHFGAELYTEQVRFFDAAEAEKIETAITAAARKSKALPRTQMADMNRKIVAIAKSSTAMMCK